MTAALDNYQIVQNEALGAHAVWEYTKYFNEYNSKNEYSPLILTLPLLPIVYNARARNEIFNRKLKEGSLLRTISETRDVYSGLQVRMESMVDLTFKSVNNAILSDLIQYDANSTRLIPIRKSPLTTEFSYGVEYDQVIQASRRVGAWFGQLDISEIMIYFNITF